MGRPKEFKMPSKGKILMGNESPAPVRPGIPTPRTGNRIMDMPKPKPKPLVIQKKSTAPMRKNEARPENRGEARQSMPSYLRNNLIGKRVTRRGGK